MYSLILGLLLSLPVGVIHAQTANVGHAQQDVSVLKQTFLGAIKSGDSRKVLAFVPEEGVQLGPKAQHTSREDIEADLLHHGELYCKLFDSSCLHPSIRLDSSARACSYRELLTKSKNIRTAATETTRNRVKQAVVVAEVHNDRCRAPLLIDFIFNWHKEGWRLFSIP